MCRERSSSDSDLAISPTPDIVIAGLDLRQECYMDVAFTDLMDGIQPVLNKTSAVLDYPVKPGNDDYYQPGLQP